MIVRFGSEVRFTHLPLDVIGIFAEAGRDRELWFLMLWILLP